MAHLIYTLRRRLPDLKRLLGSWELSIVLMVVAAEYYVLLTIWSRSTPGHVVRSIAALLPFWAVYLGLLVNTALCLWPRWGGLKRDLDRRPFEERAGARWERPVPATWGRAEVAALLGRLGLRVRPRAPEGLRGTRQRWAALGTWLFHGAFFVLATGFVLSLGVRQETRFQVAEGERLTSAPEQILSHDVSGLWDVGVPPIDLTLADVHPVFWRDQLLFTDLRADLVPPGEDPVRVRINEPWWYAPAGFLRLTSVGYTPAYEVLAPGGRRVAGSFVKLNLFPPGQQDFFVPEGLPHRVYLKVWPDWPMGADAPGRTVDMVAPLLEVAVYRGRQLLAEGRLRPGESLEVEGLRFRFPELRYWAELTAVVDPGAPLVFLGFALALLGLALKVRGKRAEVAWLPEADGRGGLLRGWGAARPPEEAA